MRKNIFEVLDKKINYSDEIHSIERILDKIVFIEGSEREFHEPSKLTVTQIINKYYLNWENRGTTNSLSDLQRRAGVLGMSSGDSPKMKDFLLYCETVYNACNNAVYHNTYNNAILPLNAILDNIEVALSKIGYKIYTYPNDIKSIAVINNENAVATAEVTDELSAIKIMEYNSHLLIGDLVGKQLILKNLADTFEKIRKKLIGNNLSSLEDDIGFLLNNLNIRHANEKGAKSGQFVDGLTKKQIEKWYDKTYNLILTAIMSLERIKISQDIKALKQSKINKENKDGKDGNAK